MKIHEIISLKESELVAKLKTMSLDELEKHAQNIMKELGEDNYGAVMSKVMKTVNNDTPVDISRFDLVQNTLRETLPNEAYMSDIYARLAAIVMMILKLKFRALYQQQ